MRNRDYHISQGLRTASVLTFIGGYMDAYSFTTQGQHFSGMQTGNLIYLMMGLASEDYLNALSYLLPIMSFIFGSIFTYFIRKYVKSKNIHWHLTSAIILFFGIILIGFTSINDHSSLTVALLAFFAAIQAESFKHVRGTPYANIMMTGNIKNFSVFLAQGIHEKNKEVFQKGKNTLFVVISFSIGAFLAAKLSNYMGNETIFLLVFPLAFLIWILYKDSGEIFY